MDQVIPQILISLSIIIPIYFLFFYPIFRKNVHLKKWKKIEEEMNSNGKGNYKITIYENRRAVEPKEKIILKELANKVSIPITELSVSSKKLFQIKFRIEFGGDEKWKPKTSGDLPHIFRSGPIHVWSDKKIDFNKFLNQFETELLDIAKKKNNPGYLIELSGSRVSFTEDFLLEDEKRIIKIINLAKKLATSPF